MQTLNDRNEWGAQVIANRGVRFRIWAPDHRDVRVAIEGERIPLPMNALHNGWHQLTTDRARAGSRYQFVLPDDRRLPDPASRFQPQDVHGPSEVIDSNSYTWSDDGWSGRAWSEAVLYELHVGTFTTEGTFNALRNKLKHFVDLGVTGIELMPIAQFPGTRNWGYDGAYPYAPAAPYGGPDELNLLVDTAHQLGLMMILDVVYNHFGPEGSYVGAYACEFFTDRHKTPWGAGINFDGPDSRPVRSFFIENALYWIREFHFDGLRLDAVHAIVDDSPLHLLDEMAERLRGCAAGRPVHLILENEENEARHLERTVNGQPMHFTAQWNDDVHHVLHAAATGESSGYYEEYTGDTVKLGRALAEGFVFQGEIMEFRGRTRGSPSAHLPTDAFVAFIQNHDQIGNRAFGERLSQITEPAALRAVAAVYLLLPQVPMLFMGEEWSSRDPFPFFCDFHGELAEAVRNGRRAEFARFPEFSDPAARQRIPDPQAELTFTSAKLDWTALQTQSHAEWLAWYRTVLATRRVEIAPRVPRIMLAKAQYKVLGALAVQVIWPMDNGEQLVLVANLNSSPIACAASDSGRSLLECNGPVADGQLPPWFVSWRVREAEGN